jgi:hypothetical protein
MPTIPQAPESGSLEQLLRRGDLWRGHSSHHLAARIAVDTGYAALNSGLLNGGWPLGSLIEVCQQGFQGEWQLFMPALLSGESRAGESRPGNPGLIVLLNPPAEPFSQALIQAGLDLDRLVIVKATEKAPFLACFTELTRTVACDAVLAWQPRANLTYTELRKCLLSASEGAGLYILFRPSSVQQQSSPASLRLISQVVTGGLEVTVFKQKGMLQRQQARPVVLSRPDEWRGLPPYHGLDQKPHPGKIDDKTPPLANVSNLRGKS